MKKFILTPLILLMLFVTVGQAAIVFTGDVSPYHESLWDLAYDATVGGVSGTPSSVTIDAGSTLGCSKLYIANVTGAEGTVTVDGTGSTLTANSTVYLNAGDATLNIINGASMPISGSFQTATAAGAEATVTLDNGSISTYGVNLSTNADALMTTITMTNGSTWDCNNYFNFGDYGPVTFSIESGSVVNCVRGYIGRFATDGKTPSNGDVTVTGAGSALNVNDASREFYVGEKGSGVLSIYDGGSVYSASKSYLGVSNGASGEVTISDAGSIWDCDGELRVGSDGNGTLSVLNGGTLDSAGVTYVGTNATSTGVVNVSGADSTWTSGGALHVGTGGIGTLNVTNGGVVNQSANVTVAERTGAQGTILVDNGTLTSGAMVIGKADATGSLTIANGGSWTTSSYFEIGSGGSGTFRVESGAVADTNRVYMGRYATTTGTSSATVTGMGSTWIIPGTNLYVGWYSDATLTVEDGGTVDHDGITIIGYEAGVAGSVTVLNGTLDTTGYMRIGNSGTGTLDVSNNGVVNSDEIRVGSSNTGTMTIASGGIVNSGSVYIARNDGTGTCTVSIDGTGSALNSTGEIVVGRNETGILSVTDGAAVSNATDAFVGYRGAYDDGNGGLTAGTGAATISGTGSSWSVGGTLAVGGYADERTFPGVPVTATLNIENGATVDVAGETFIGQDGATAKIQFTNGTLNTGSLGADFSNLAGTGEVYTKGLVANGSLTFDASNGLTRTYSGVGADSGVTVYFDADGTGTMGAGYDAPGTLTVADGVVLESSAGILARAPEATTTASVSGEGTAWHVAGTLDVGQMGAATLTITDGGLVSAGSLCIDQDISIEAEGGFDGFYNYVNFTGDPIYAGDPSEQFSIVADSFVNISGGGMLALLGDYSTDLTTFIAAIDGSSEAVQWWDDASNDWASLSTATLGTDCTLEYLDSGDLAGYTLLTVAGGETPKVPGDANKDGKVDGSDVTILAGNWQYGVVGGGATWEMGDFNGDGKVDGSDVTILAGNWQYGVTTANASVPEPSTLIMLVLGMIAALVLRKR